MPSENVDHGGQEIAGATKEEKPRGVGADDQRLSQEVGEITRAESNSDVAITKNLKP